MLRHHSGQATKREMLELKTAAKPENMFQCQSSKCAYESNQRTRVNGFRPYTQVLQCLNQLPKTNTQLGSNNPIKKAVKPAANSYRANHVAIPTFKRSPLMNKSKGGKHSPSQQTTSSKSPPKGSNQSTGNSFVTLRKVKELLKRIDEASQTIRNSSTVKPSTHRPPSINSARPTQSYAEIHAERLRRKSQHNFIAKQ